MKRPHFFKTYSRLGIRTFPSGTDDLNSGVENAPDIILTTEFLKHFPESRVSTYTFPSPDRLNETEYHELLAKQIKGFRDMLSHSLQHDEQQIVIGGDHIVSLPSVLAVIERADQVESVGYIHLDSHGDSNRFATSPTGNFHGIYLRPLTDSCGVPMIDALVPAKLPDKNLIMIGNLDLDPEEKEFISKERIRTINLEQIRKNTEQIIAYIAAFANRFEYLHVSLDIDVLDSTIAPATGIPAENGFLLRDITLLLDIFAEHPNLSFDLSEVNPTKPGGEETVKIAQEILKQILR